MQTCRIEYLITELWEMYQLSNQYKTNQLGCFSSHISTAIFATSTSFPLIVSHMINVYILYHVVLYNLPWIVYPPIQFSSQILPLCQIFTHVKFQPMTSGRSRVAGVLWWLQHPWYLKNITPAILRVTIFWQWRSTYYLPNAVLNRTCQGKLRTPARAHANTRSVCTCLKAASVCLRHCQEIVRRSIVGQPLDPCAAPRVSGPAP